MFDAYKIGVTLSLTNHVSRGLMLMAGDFAKTEAQASALQKRISSIQNDAIKGGLFLAAGAGMLSLFKVPLEEAKKFEAQVGKFKLFGMSDAQNAEAVKFAKAMDIMGSSARENMKLITEAQGVFRESGHSGSSALEGAKLAAPMLAKINFATASLDDESKGKMRSQSMAMLRFVEMRGGLKDAKTFNDIADSGWKAIQSSGGNVNWEQLRQFQARGGVAAQGLSDRALYGQLEPIIGELKGATAGTALMTAYNRLIGGVRIPNQVAHLLADNGLWDAKKVTWNSQGGIKSFNGNPLKDMDLLTKAPADFYEQKILPMYAKMNNGKGLDQAERNRENLMIFGRTGGAMFSLIDRQMATIHKSVDAWEKALGVDKSVDVAGNTLAGKEVDLHAKFNTLMLALGDSVLPLAVKGLEILIPAIKGLTDWINNNQGAVKALAGAFVILASGLMMRGTILLLSAAFRGLGLALVMNSVGGARGIAALSTRLVGLGGGISSVAGVTGLAGLGATLGTVAVGLGVLYGAVKAMESLLDWAMPNEVDPKTGRKRAGRSSFVVPGWTGPGSLDATPPAHPGEHFVRSGRSGYWKKDVDPVGAPASSNGKQTINNTIVMPDGRVLAKVVTQEQAKSASAPQSGIGRIDPSMTPISPGMNVR